MVGAPGAVDATRSSAETRIAGGNRTGTACFLADRHRQLPTQSTNPLRGSKAVLLPRHNTRMPRGTDGAAAAMAGSGGIAPPRVRACARKGASAEPDESRYGATRAAAPLAIINWRDIIWCLPLSRLDPN